MQRLAVVGQVVGALRSTVEWDVDADEVQVLFSWKRTLSDVRDKIDAWLIGVRVGRSLHTEDKAHGEEMSWDCHPHSDGG